MVRRCTFIDNTARDLTGSGGSGGAVVVSGATTVIDCLFIGNSTGSPNSSGGGLSIWSSDSIVAGCRFIDCASDLGGGVCISKYCTAELVNCTFSGCQAATGAGVGLYYATSVTLHNTIIAFSGQGEAFAGTGTKTLNHCNLFGNAGGDWTGDIASQLGINGNIAADPLFADHAGGDVHLTWTSPCRNSGDDAPVTMPTDFEDDPRISGASVDMGADEYHYHLYLTGTPAPGNTVTFNVVGVPGTNPVKIYRGSLRSTPLSTQYGLLYIKQPFPHIWNVGPVSADGMAATSKTIPSGVSPGAEFYFQALHGPAGNANTKLTNLLTVTVE